MKQSRSTSLAKSLISTAVGFGLSVAAQAIVLPAMGIPMPLEVNIAFACVMTVLSIARQFALERAFEALGWRQKVSPFAAAVLAERQRQIEVEGWSAEHDAQEHSPLGLAQAGAAYLIGARRFVVTDYEADESDVPVSGRILWPWGIDWWKPDTLRRDLVRGCALAIAAGELADNRKAKR